MCAARRTVSTRLTRLAVKASPYHSVVTLYEATSDTVKREQDDLEAHDAKPSVSTSRRSRRVRVKQEPKDLDSETPTLAPDTSQGNAKPESGTGPQLKPKSKGRSKSKTAARGLDAPHPTPDKWEDVYAAIKEMRSRAVAPVDTMGCDQAQYGEQDPKNQRFSTLVSLMLSSQTKDEVTDAAVRRLRTALGGSLSVQAVLDADDAVISDAIAKVGFWRRKTQYIKQTARRLQEDFDADVPKTADELCSLPGVGPKMAYLALQVAWNLNAGIGVDVHVHRITNRLGWHARPTKTPEETRLNLESWLPKVLHGDINHMLVGFGQTICLPVGPKCGDCTLSAAGLCPSAQPPRSRGGTKTKSRAQKTAPQKRSEPTMGEVEDIEGAGPQVEIEMEEAGPIKGGTEV